MNLLTLLAPAGVIAYALNLLLHLTVICLVVLGASHLFFRRDPAMRHTLCLTGLVCLLLAPIVVGMETKAGSGLVTLALPSVTSAKGSNSVRSTTDKPYRVAISAMLPTQPIVAWGGWAMLAAYMLGVGCGALRLAHGCRRASRLKLDVSPWGEAADCLILHTPERVLPPAPPVFTSPHVASPIAIGLLHPAIILPEGLAETLSPQQLRHVLLHEYAHVAFRHGLGGLLERIAGVLFWPHPLVRMLCRELGRAREEVCDNFASQEDGATCYARTLLTIAQGIDTAPNLVSTLALLGAGTSLEARIAGLLDPRRDRMVSLKRWKLWAATGTAAFAIASTAAVRIVTSQEHTGSLAEGAQLRNDTLPRVFAFRLPQAARSVTPPTLPTRVRAFVWRLPNPAHRRPETAQKMQNMTLKIVNFRATTVTRRQQHKTMVSLCKPTGHTLITLDSGKVNKQTLGTANLDTPPTSDRVHLSSLMQTEPDSDDANTQTPANLYLMFHLTANGHQDAQIDIRSEDNDTAYEVPLNIVVSHDNSSGSVGKTYNAVLDTTDLETQEVLVGRALELQTEARETLLRAVQENEDAQLPRVDSPLKAAAEIVAARLKTEAIQGQIVADRDGDQAEESASVDASQAVKITLEDMPEQGTEQNKTLRAGLPEKTATE
ncbi:MAG: blaR1 3 [Chthonomonadales bacterium]|nr:blaR1 3 [Chthonomonadales bacterium]